MFWIDASYIRCIAADSVPSSHVFKRKWLPKPLCQHNLLTEFTSRKSIYVFISQFLLDRYLNVKNYLCNPIGGDVYYNLYNIPYNLLRYFSGLLLGHPYIYCITYKHIDVISSDTGIISYVLL
jgi:hypothetical protein